MQYYTCPDCGANLDCNEVCDCKKEKQSPENEDCSSSNTRAKIRTYNTMLFYHKKDIKSSISVRGCL